MPITTIDVPYIGKLDLQTHVAGDPYISGSIQIGQVFQPDLLEILNVLIQPGGRFMDVGANLGWFAVIGSRMVGPAGKVYAIEPDPDNFRLLEDNARLNGCRNIKALRIGAGERRRRSTLSLSQENRGDHRVHDAIISDRKSIQVDVKSVDQVLWPIRKMDVILIDTQGSEVHVFRGMKKTLRRNKLVRIIFEYWPHGLESCGSTAEELTSIVQDYGWILWRLDEGMPPKRIAADDLLTMAKTDLSAASMKHTDIIALSPKDAEAIAAIDALSKSTEARSFA